MFPKLEIDCSDKREAELVSGGKELDGVVVAEVVVAEVVVAEVAVADGVVLAEEVVAEVVLAEEVVADGVLAGVFVGEPEEDIVIAGVDVAGAVVCRLLIK